MIFLSCFALQLAEQLAVVAPSPAGVPVPVLQVLFWTGALACLIAQFFIVRAVWKVIPSVTGSPSVPEPRRALELLWVLLPVVLLSAAFVGAWRNLHPQMAVSVNAAAPHA